MKLINFVSSLFLSRVLRLAAAHSGHTDGLHSRLVTRASSSTNSTTSLLNKAIDALGGEAALNNLERYQASAFVYRTQTLVESELPGVADLATAVGGIETITYDLSNDNLLQRIDRTYRLSNWLYFARPLFDDGTNNVSYVVRDGTAGYACYIKGNEDVFLPTNDQLWGYLDASLTRVLLREAVRQSPRLLLSVAQHPNSTIATTLPFQGVDFPAVLDSSLGLAVLFDNETSLPYVVRIYEDHAIYGRSSNDLVLYNYTTVNNLQFPLHTKIIYNQKNVLVDTWFTPPVVNPSIEAGFFNGVPVSTINQTATKLPPTPANVSAVYGDAEVFEMSQSLLWNNGYTGTLANVVVTHPLPNLPNLYHLVFSDAPAYTTLVADFGSAVMAVDAPKHQSLLVIQWIRENLNKDPTHLLITHHHHDHNYGASDFVAAGATLVVPEEYKYYWTSIPNVTFATATEEQPFVYRNDEMQVRGVWHSKVVHANDWMYFAWTVACPTDEDQIGLSVADAWSPGFASIIYFDQEEAQEYLDVVRGDQVQRDSLVIPIHGVPTNSTELYELTGNSYPDFVTTDFLPGEPWC